MSDRKNKRGGLFSFFERQYRLALISLRLRRRMRNEAHAEVITEKSYSWSVEERRLLWRHRLWLFLIGISCVIVLLYFLVIPIVALNITRATLPPSLLRESYKRSVKLTIDHLPAESSVKDAPIRQLARGALYTVTASTDVFVDRGLQGVFRMNVGSADPQVTEPIMSITYRVATNEQDGRRRAYVIFSQWPQIFQEIIPLPPHAQQWYVYDAGSGALSSPALDALITVPSRSSGVLQHGLIQLFLSHALRMKALQVSAASLPYKNVRGAQVLNIDWTVNTRRLPAILNSLTSDPRYRQYAGLMQTSVAGLPSMEKLFSSLRSLAGSATIGIFDKTTHSSSLFFYLSNESIGHLRGRVTMDVDATSSLYNPDAPQNTVPFPALLERINAFLRLSSEPPYQR